MPLAFINIDELKIGCLYNVNTTVEVFSEYLPLYGLSLTNRKFTHVVITRLNIKRTEVINFMIKIYITCASISQ